MGGQLRSTADAPRRPKIQGARSQTSVQPMIPVAEPGVGVELHRDPDSRSTAQVYEEQDMDGACLGSGATGVSPHPQRLGGVHEEAVRHAPEGSQTQTYRSYTSSPMSLRFQVIVSGSLALGQLSRASFV